MSETTIAEPLSGEEIVEAVKEEVGRVMVRDCRLNPALAYVAFRCRVFVEMDLRDGADGVHIEVEVLAKGGPAASLVGMPVREGRGELAERPPNLVRREAGLAIPTLVEDGQGRKEVRPVKYARRTEHEHPGHEHDKDKDKDKEQEKKPGQEQPQQPHPGHTGPEKK